MRGTIIGTMAILALAQAPNLALAEVDHNIIPGVNDGTEPLAVEEVPVAPAPVKAKPVPAPKATPDAVPLREIPSIETENEGHHSDEVNFVTGGVGEEERAAIEASREDYNLYVTSTAAGAFTGDVRVVIRQFVGSTSEEVLDVVAGPLLYVKLPAGNYSLEASLGERVQRQAFSIRAKAKASRIVLNWKTK